MIYAKDFAKQYDSIYKESYYKNYSNFIKRIAEERGIKNSTIFDIGCGTGRLIEYFKNWKCLGIDFSEDMARIAKERNKKATVSIGEFNNKIKGKFDVIVSTFDTVNYITKNNKIKSFFKNIKEHIKDGGIFIFDFNTNEKKIPVVVKKKGFTYYGTIYNKKYWKIKIVSDSGYTEYHLERLYSFKEMKNLINNAGLKIAEIYSDFKTKIKKPKKEQRLIIIVNY